MRQASVNRDMSNFEDERVPFCDVLNMSLLGVLLGNG